MYLDGNGGRESAQDVRRDNPMDGPRGNVNSPPNVDVDADTALW